MAEPTPTTRAEAIHITDDLGADLKDAQEKLAEIEG
jgi:hypothetical protein